MSTVDGLITGLDTASIINQLMEIERLPQTRAQQKQDFSNASADALDELRSLLAAVGDAAAELSSGLDWERVTGTSSDEAVKVTTSTLGGIPGSLDFSVVARATADIKYSTDTIADLDTVVASGGSIFSARNFSKLGLESLTGTSLPVGEASFEVTTASDAAYLNATVTIPSEPPVDIDITNDTLELEVNGVKHEVTLPHSTYDDPVEMVTQIQSALDDAGIGDVVRAGLTPVDALQFKTVGEGTAHTLQVTASAGANQALYQATADAFGLTVGALATGVDGVIDVNGVTTNITDTADETPMTLSAGTGSIDVVVAGPIRLGTAQVEQIGFGDGSLAETVSAINSAGNSPVLAAAVAVGDGSFRLQLTATESGDDSDLGIDLAMFTGLPGGFTTLVDGEDAVIEIQGTNPYQVRSSTNVFSDLLPGATVELLDDPAGAVEVDLAVDGDGIADRVKTMVDAANKLMERVGVLTAYDAETNQSALLAGSSVVRRAVQTLTSAFTAPVAASGVGSPGLAGVELDREGKFTFDRAVFLEALAADPESVERLFTDADEGVDPGLAARISTVVDDATASGTGFLRTAADAAKDQADDYGRQIDAMEHRMVQREDALRRIYANLEVALGELQQQSQWLGSQLSALNA
ncbi:MAG: flagellar filament capping protein FliD [Actinomycetia bacterium]|nr:flagellar filament capping protein FliD [Actinomycetes bacterium]MCP3911080.1 flagellar filament capping protein FliD [Actinomycetes bacterium]MCP4085637.1 flagellar filament capping protein FliD [Actinomycetes bacterium]